MLPPTNLNGPVNSLNAQLRIPDGSEQQYYNMHAPNGDGISPSAHSGHSHSAPGPDSMGMPSLGKMPSLTTTNSTDDGPDLNNMRNSMEAQLAGGHDIPSGSPFYNGRNMMRPTSDGMGNHMNNAAALSSLSNDYYRMNGAGNNFTTMQAHFPASAGQYGGYAQQDPYYQNLSNYAQGIPTQNFHDPSVVSDESSLKQFNNNGKRSFYGSDLQQGNPNPGYGDFMQPDKRLRPDFYSAAGIPNNNPYGDYGNNFASHQQMMNMPQDGMFFNGQLPQAAMQQYSSLSSMPPPEAERPKKSSKKKQPSGDMPRRPLTAYNFFFSEEREFILAQIPDNDSSDDSVKREDPVKRESPPPKTEGEGDDKDGKAKEEEVKEVDPVEKILASMRTLSEEEKEELHKKVRENTERMLTIHKQSERVKKPHKKVHGKIAFRHLAKIVGSRWRNLTPEKKKYYEEIAAKDSNRYNDDLAAYNKTK